LALSEHKQAATAQDFVVWVGCQAQNAFSSHHFDVLEKVVWVVGGRSFKHGPIVEVRFWAGPAKKAWVLCLCSG
jgi:hypothetical protein